jgi:hypothetical protein
VPSESTPTTPWDAAPYDPIWAEFSERIEAELAERDVPGIQAAEGLPRRFPTRRRQDG